MTRSRDLYTGPADIQETFRGLNDNLEKVRERLIVPGVLIEGRAFAVGDNTVLHKLGRKPRMWHMSRPRGAYGTQSTGGGGGSIYPDIGLHKYWWDSNQHAADTSASYTMGFTPTDGNRLIAVVIHAYSNRSVSSISQSGVTWAKVAGSSADWTTPNLLCEMWMGTSVSDW